MNREPDRLYELLPVVHRQRDAAQGYPLRALLRVIAEQVGVVEDDLDRLYDNWFIETCEDWVVPYVADLIGYRAAHEAGQPLAEEAAERRLNRILVPRREVANTLRYRRRRGTLAMLELLARDVAGWPARAVEFYRLLAWTQALNHQRVERGRTADLRDGDALDLLDGPFDRVAHTGDVRRIGSGRTRGRYDIPSVGLFAWRLRAYPVTRVPALCLEPVGAQSFTFSVLGNDTPLFTKPTPEPSPHHIAGPLNVPAPIRRRALERDLDGYYGEGKSLAIWVDSWAGHTLAAPVPPETLIVADLSGWQYRPPRDRIAVDPVLGRLAFPPRQLPRRGVWVSYHYGFSDDLGGGEYARPVSQPDGAVVYRVGAGADFERINDALVRWREEQPQHAVVEITDSGVYVEQVNLDLAAEQSFQLRAAPRTRPVLRLMDWQTARPDALWVHGEEGSRFTLDGMLVAGRSVHCHGPLAAVTLRHSTLVPGWTLGPDCEPSRPAEPGLELTDTHACVVIERTILGSIQVSLDEVGTDPVVIQIADSILDATSPEREAIGAPSWPLAHAILTLRRTTVFGEIQTHAIELAENSIFVGRIRVARRQLGCMRFCYVTPGSRTPRRYRCQPDAAEQSARAAIPKGELGGDAEAQFSVDGQREPRPRAAPAGAANLELSFEVGNPRPAVGQEVPLTVTLHNQGPRDAHGIEVLLRGPETDQPCLDFPAGTVFPDDLDEIFFPSQGSVGEGPEEAVLWKAGSIPAGGAAMLTTRGILVVNQAGACGELTTLTATITAATLTGDADAFIAERIRHVRRRIRPRFNSVRYGTPTYAQLAAYCPDEIARGAEDESEMGAFHDLFQPQRADNLEARLDESVPAGMDTAIIYAS